MSYELCGHGQMKRKCPLCDAAEDIKQAYIEGFNAGFEAGTCNNGDDPMDTHHYPKSDAKINSESLNG